MDKATRELHNSIMRGIEEGLRAYKRIAGEPIDACSLCELLLYEAAGVARNDDANMVEFFQSVVHVAAASFTSEQTDEAMRVGFDSIRRMAKTMKETS